MTPIFNPVQYIQYCTWKRKEAFGHFQKKLPQLNFHLTGKKKIPFASLLQNTSLTRHQIKHTLSSFTSGSLECSQLKRSWLPFTSWKRVTLFPQMSLPWITGEYSQLLFVLKSENVSLLSSMWSSSNSL